MKKTELEQVKDHWTHFREFLSKSFISTRPWRKLDWETREFPIGTDPNTAYRQGWNDCRKELTKTEKKLIQFFDKKFEGLDVSCPFCTNPGCLCHSPL